MRKLRKINAKFKPLLIVTLLSVVFSGGLAQSQVSLPDSGLIYILDNSGSMAEVFQGDLKLNAAKKAMKQALENPQLDSLNMGLLEIGGYCEVKQLVSPDLNNRQAIIAASNNVRPRLYLDAATPIAESIYQASKMLEKYQGKKRIILVSDGEANCQGNGEFPLSACDMVASLNNQGIDFSLKLIGYGAKNNKEFECIANLSDNYSYSSPNTPEALNKEFEQDSNWFLDLQKSKNLIEQITEFLLSIKELIIVAIGILAILLGTNKPKASENGGSIDQW